MEEITDNCKIAILIETESGRAYQVMAEKAVKKMLVGVLCIETGKLNCIEIEPLTITPIVK